LGTVTVCVRGALAQELHLNDGTTLVEIDGDITIAGALARAGIDTQRLASRGSLLIVCNNRIYSADGQIQVTLAAAGSVIELLPVAPGG
jgi:hypothetical protein